MKQPSKPSRPENIAPQPERPKYGHSVSWLPLNVSPVVLAMSLCFGSPASADILASPSQPGFSRADFDTIARNELLRETVRTDAWLVFKIMRLLDDLKQQPSNRSGPLPIPELDMEPAQNPDLNAIQRVAPEAAQDLFQLIKEAERQRGEQKKPGLSDEKLQFNRSHP